MRNYIGQTIKKHKYDYVVITEVQSRTARLALSEKKKSEFCNMAIFNL